jgi:putative PIN family toxin of toxin-antitoxin system
MQPLVLDTNVVLDAWLFDDPAAVVLREPLARGDVRWLATAAMRDELLHVLAYPHLAARAAARGHSPQDVLAAFDRHAALVDAPHTAPLLRCRDPDDQKFIDLALAHRSLLISKDKAVLALRRRLAAREVRAAARWSELAPHAQVSCRT